ncbi:polynucleotide adenylyltransferase PcnB [Chromatiaceae bacterium AAb-1]|nr:polynucleotide adenylyltransferase PcnB [Chromatiaceae bacterium AAb-1]
MLDFCRRTFAGKGTGKSHTDDKQRTGPVRRPSRPALNLSQNPSRQSSLPALQIISRDRHAISRRDISPNALKVLYRLKDAGYEAYLVGGCIRDLLMGLKPKDFDVVTNAHPEQVKQVFRNCRLIGRRFRLAHVVFGREVIEVATFRAHHNSADDEESSNSPAQKQASLSDHGQILRDNVYGTIDEDAERRDFTINALYYSVKDFAIYDFANGMQAIAERKVELIGDPQIRYREDPVRMLRAIRFATKLNMQIAPVTAAPIPELSTLLKNIPAPRLFDELIKMWMAGKGFDNFMLMRDMKVLKPLLPQLDKLLRQEPEGKAFQLVTQALQDTDQRIATDKPVTPAFIFAAMLWYPVELRCQTLLLESGLTENDAMNIAISEILDEVQHSIAIPKRFSLSIRDIWLLQNRLTRRAGRRAFKLLELPKFRGAYDFLQLRAKAEGGDLPELALWWERFQQTDEEGRLELIQQLGKEGQEKPRRRRNYKRKHSSETND